MPWKIFERLSELTNIRYVGTQNEVSKMSKFGDKHYNIFIQKDWVKDFFSHL